MVPLIEKFHAFETVKYILQKNPEGTERIPTDWAQRTMERTMKDLHAEKRLKIIEDTKYSSYKYLLYDFSCSNFSCFTNHVEFDQDLIENFKIWMNPELWFLYWSDYQVAVDQAINKSEIKYPPKSLDDLLISKSLVNFLIKKFCISTSFFYLGFFIE